MKSGFQQRNNFFILLVCLVVGIFVLLFLYKKQQEDFLVVSFLNVGQGDAIFIETPNGNQVLVDAGPNSGIVRELDAVLPFWDRTIDMIIPTHADKDHIGGFSEIFSRYRVRSIYDMHSEATTGVFENYEIFSEKEEAAIREARGGDTIMLDSKHGVYMRVLFPEGNVSNLDRNDTSTVIQLVYQDHSFLLTGDAGLVVEDYLMRNFGDGLKSTVLKAGHHGSRTSTGEDFLSLVDPDYVVISAGSDNSYGHPHQEVVDAIIEQGSIMLETKNGTIQFVTNGKELFLQ